MTSKSPCPISSKQQEVIKGDDQDRILEQANFLIERLERISADSIWAHRSSGLRGTILQLIEEWESAKGIIDSESADHSLRYKRMTGLIETGFIILEKAAREYLK